MPRTAPAAHALAAVAALSLACGGSVAAQDDAGRQAEMIRLAAQKDRVKALENVTKPRDPKQADLVAHAVCEVLASGQDKATTGAGLVALGRVRPDLAEHVSALVFGRYPSKERKAVKMAAKLASDARPALPVLIAHLGRVAKDNATSIKAPDQDSLLVEGLAALRAVAPDSRDVLVAHTALAEGHPVLMVRRRAAESMGKLGKAYEGHRPEVVASLVRILGDPANTKRTDASPRRAAIVALGEFGTQAEAAAPVLRKLVSDPDRPVAEAALKALQLVESRK